MALLSTAAKFGRKHLLSGRALATLKTNGSTVTSALARAQNVAEPKIVIQKFGGTCLKDEASVQNVCSIVEEHRNQYDMVIPVVSAVSSDTKEGGTSSLIIDAMNMAAADDMYNLGRKLDLIEEMNQGDSEYAAMAVRGIRLLCQRTNELGKVRPHHLDQALRKGEYMAVRGLTKAIGQGHGLVYGELWSDLFAHQMPFDQKTAIWRMQDRFRYLLQHRTTKGGKSPVIVCSGHMASMQGGVLSAIGRGYTDYTAALIASATGAQQLQIWKESAGVFEANPAIVPDAGMLQTVTVDELVELTAFGNEVVHPLAAQLMKHSDFRTGIMDITDPNRGTRVLEKGEQHEDGRVTAICSESGLTIVDLVPAQRSPGPLFLQTVFGAFAGEEIRAKLVSTSMGHVSVVFEAGSARNQVSNLVSRLKKLGVRAEARNKKSIVACVGQGMRGKTGIASLITNVFGQQNINIEMLSQDCTEISVCAVVDDACCSNAVKALHSALIKEK